MLTGRPCSVHFIALTTFAEAYQYCSLQACAESFMHQEGQKALTLMLVM